MKYTLTIITVSLFITSSWAQISYGGDPYSWQQTSSKTYIETILLEAVQIPKLDNINYNKHDSFKFAEIIELNKSTNEIGEWTILDNGDRLWQVKLKSEGAYSLNFIFSRFLIPEGAKLYVYSPNKENKLGAFTHKNNKKYGSLAIAPIPGDEIIIEYYEPEDVDFIGELIIGDIGHDYLNIFGNKDGQFGASGDCNIDINCSEGSEWQSQKRSICRMIIDNIYLCTGALVNNTAEDQEPYILSANHCIDNQASAESAIFVFNYESPSCGGTDGSVQQSISGADLVATKNNNQGYLDFTLLRLSSDVPLDYRPYFAGWNNNGSVPETTTCIHHPQGDVKKISHDFDASEQTDGDDWGYDPNSFWRINNWDNGTTEGGSSGSPIFDQNKHIVGTLTGGEASCSVDSCDYFQMFSISYNKYDDDSMQLKHWLNPINSNVEFIDGFDTYNDDFVITDTIKHWDDDQTLAFYLADDGGYMAGNNAYHDKAKAEFFNINEFDNKDAIIGAYVAFKIATGRDTQSIELQVLNDNLGVPSSILGTSSVSLKKIKENADIDFVYFRFDPPVEINNSVYVSVVLPQYEGDTVALMTVEEAVINTAWELSYYNDWFPYSDAENSWGINLAHLIKLEIGNFTAINNYVENKPDINIYPNPATNEININLNNNSSKDIIIDIYEPFGRLVQRENYYSQNDEIKLNISSLQKGFYLMAINIDNKVITKKFIKE